MKLRGVWVVALVGAAACGASTSPMPDLIGPVDLANPPVEDLAALVDLSTPSDLQPPTDLSPPIVPPAAVWWSTGGGASVGSATATRGGFSIGPRWVAGRSTATSGAVLTFGYFSSSNL